MSKKIIFILCHTLNNDETLHYHIYGNFAARTARNILKHTNKYICEVWCAINNFSKKQIFKKDNITYKLFPAKTLNKLLESFFGIIQSPEFLNDLKKEDSKNTIIHFQGERGSLIHTIIKKNPQFIYAIQYHGYGQPWWLDWVEKFFLTPIEKQTFPLISHFFVHIQGRIKYLKNTIKIPEDKISFQNVGVDFENFKPGNKKKARDKLDLPKTKFIILYVGRLVKTKGVDKILKAYQLLKKKHNRIYLLFIGGQKDDPMYEEVKNTADKIIDIVKNEDLPLYYNASDVYCFYGDKKTIQYAGVGTAPTEALACNMNVISTNLIHIPGFAEKKVGFIPKNFNDFVSRIEYFIYNPTFKFNPRKKVAQYTSYEYMTKNLISIYDRIFSKTN